MSRYLNQTIAVEKGIKSRVTSKVSDLYKTIQKEDLFDGFYKSFEKKTEEQEDDFPAESKVVQFKVEDLLGEASKSWTELFDVVAEQEYANGQAKADIVVDGNPLLSDVPVTYLLFLEKQITDIRSFVDKLPVLDNAEEWDQPVNSDFYRSKEKKIHRTKKTVRPIVKYDATKEHPAQTDLISEDVVIGYWNTVRHSGALPIPRKKELLERINKFLDAVKKAREKANMLEVEKKDVGSSVFGYLFSK